MNFFYLANLLTVVSMCSVVLCQDECHEESQRCLQLEGLNNCLNCIYSIETDLCVNKLCEGCAFELIHQCPDPLELDQCNNRCKGGCFCDNGRCKKYYGTDIGSC